MFPTYMFTIVTIDNGQPWSISFQAHRNVLTEERKFEHEAKLFLFGSQNISTCLNSTDHVRPLSIEVSIITF